jgi:aspartyl/asparaginyl beta-hydroxylase (cupin superfamily)
MKIINIIIICAIVIYLFNYIYENHYKMNEKFYDYKKIYPKLSDIQQYKNDINIEINNINKNWMNWPESGLYSQFEEKNIIYNKNKDSWQIIPLYGFGIWCEEYCNKLPSIHKFLKSLPNLKIALLSKMKPETKLRPHCGWGVHSNNVLRCHYGLVLPKNNDESYVAIKDNYKVPDNMDMKQNHKLHDWIVFDDSKIHYAVNNSDTERIVLIIDMERPSYVKKGTTKQGSTKELIDLVNSFKNTNTNISKKLPKEYLDLIS